MATKVVFFLVALSWMFNLALLEEMGCFSCGYEQLPNGTRVPISSEFEDVAFCGVDNLNETLDAPIAPMYPVRNFCIFNADKYRLLVFNLLNNVEFPNLS